MRVVCAIGVRGGADIVREVIRKLTSDLELVLVHVIDTRPRRDLEQLGPAWRGRPTGEPLASRELDAAEEYAGQAALQEAQSAAREEGVAATIRLERGSAEHVIVRAAEEERAALVVIHASDWPAQRPSRGPASIGHTARFVLDHAPCDVLLIRAPVENA